MTRLEKIYAKLKQRSLDCLLVTSEPNISYLTEFTSRDSCLLVSRDTNIYFTDSRYTREAKIGLKKHASVQRIAGPPPDAVAGTLRKLGLKRIGFEEAYLSFAAYKKLKDKLGDSFKLSPVNQIVEELRQVKDKDEIAKISKATQITMNALKFIRGFIRSGKKESEVAAELERFMRYNGAEKSAFDITVASGPNSSFPHHLTSPETIKDNELVLIDIGASFRGYKSDLTRVFFSGKINGPVRKIYDIVRKAQDKAIRAIRPGVPIKRIDELARNHIRQKGLGKYFLHALGHGIGLEVHEAPGINGREKALLKKGMIFSIEPAVYLPGKFGIRIEDVVLVTRQGCEVLSGACDK